MCKLLIFKYNMMKRILLLALGICFGFNGFTQWQQMETPRGIKINNFYSSNNDFYACTSKGLYKYNTGIWSKLSEDINFNISSLISHGDYLFTGSTSEGVYRSSDNGNTWLQINNNLTSTNVQEILLYKNYLMVGTSNGLFASDNNGVQWADKSGNLEDKRITTIIEFTDSLIVGTQNGIFMSSDTAKTWNSKSSGLNSKIISDIVSVNNKLFASTSGGGIYVSDNSAETWSSENLGLTNLNVNVLYYKYDTLFAGTSDSLYYTTNLTNINWQSLAVEVSIEEVLSISQNDDNLIIGNSLGAFLKGNIFHEVNQGFPTWSISNISGYDSSLYISTNVGVWLQANNDDWTLQNEELSSINKIILYQDTIYLLINNDGLYQSTDTLKTWNSVVENSHLTSITTVDSLIFLGTNNNGILRSDDSGESWLPYNIGLAYTSVKNIVVNGNAIYLQVTSDYNSKVYKSVNNGEEWSELNVPSYSKSDIYAFAEKLLVSHCCLGELVYSNSDNEDNFQDIDSVFLFNYQFGIIITKFSSINGALFAGSNDGGVYMSLDSGKIWTQMNRGLDFEVSSYRDERHFSSILDIEILSDSILYIRNSENNIYSRNISDFILPPTPINLTVYLDSIDYQSYNLHFDWEMNSVENINEYLLLPNTFDYIPKDSPRDTIIYKNTSVSGWYNENLEQELKSYRIAANNSGDLSLPSGYSKIKEQEVLSITDIDFRIIKTYPNPVHDIFTIDIPQINGEQEMSIYNSLGQKIDDRKITNKITKINFSEYDNGIYLILISDKSKFHSIKIIKQ